MVISNRPYQWAGVSRPQLPSFRRGGLPNKPDHARAYHLPQPEVPSRFDYPANRDGRRRNGCGQSLNGRWAFYRPIEGVLCSADDKRFTPKCAEFLRRLLEELSADLV